MTGSGKLIIEGIVVLVLVQLTFLGLGWIIQPPDNPLNDPVERFSLSWARVNSEPDLETLQPPPPPPPDIPPVTQQEMVNPAPNTSAMSTANTNLNAQLGLPELAMDVGNPNLPTLTQGVGTGVPVYRAEPNYPRQALARRVEGWVELAFQVDGQGRVIPETIEVVEAEPQNMFEREARRAIARWRFSEDELGRSRHLRQRLEFRL